MADGVEENGEKSNASAQKEPDNRGVSKLDLILRFVAILGIMGSAIAMATAGRTHPFSGQFFSFRADSNDLPTFRFFVIVNAIVCAYLVLSLALSILHIVKSNMGITRIVLIFLDTIMLSLLTAGASAAAGIIQMAHKGNAICQQFGSFCDRVSGSLVGSYIGAVLMVILIVLSAIALSRH